MENIKTEPFVNTELVEKVKAGYKEILMHPQGKPAKEQMEELNKRLLEEGFVMQGKPFPTFLKPYFLEEKVTKMIGYTTNIIMDCIEKVSEFLLANPKLEKYYELAPLEKELSMIDFGYPRRVIQARLDAFLNDDALHFLEFNCDSPSGMGWHDRLIELIAETPVVQELDAKYHTWRDRLVPNFYKMLCKKYRQFWGKEPEGDNFAIISGRESTIRNDVELLIKYFNNNHNQKAFFADPRDGEYDGKHFTMMGEKVGLVYRDAIQDFTNHWDEVQPFVRALRDKKVCLINPFTSRIGGLKCILWFMTDERLQHIFTPEEREVISKCIPWTRFMADEETNFHDKKVSLLDFVSKNKDNFVLKPNSGYGGFNVTIGRESEQAKWDEIINLCHTQKWVVQEYVKIPKDDYPVFDPEMRFITKNVNINFFAFDGEYGGGFVRVADSSIINIHQGGGLIPICYVK